MQGGGVMMAMAAGVQNIMGGNRPMPPTQANYAKFPMALVVNKFRQHEYSIGLEEQYV
jgi:hypothetical protein